MRRSVKAVAFVAAGLATAWVVHRVDAATVQDFDVGVSGTPWTSLSLSPLPECPPLLLAGGPSGEGRFLRLAHGQRAAAGCDLLDPPPEDPNSNSITFDLSDPGPHAEIVADFDLRLEPVTGRADGFGVAFLNTAFFPSPGGVGPAAAPFVAEEPNFEGSLGIGFDIFRSDDLGEIDDNHVSIHFDEIELAEFSANDLFDQGGGQWFHVRILVHAEVAASEVTVVVTPCGGRPVVLVADFPVPGMSPYESRMYFAARSGGLASHQDLDNVRVEFSDLEQEIFSLVSSSFFGTEGEPFVEIEVRRTGSAAGASVDYDTEDRSAIAGQDYTTTSDTLSFGAGEMTKTFTVPLLNDVTTEGVETFRVALQSPSSGILGGPADAVVHVVDDETARVLGHWSAVLCWPVVPIHLHLLPTGNVLLWGRKGEGESVSELPKEHGAGDFEKIRLWDPETLELMLPALPGHDIFCSGHSFLADGTLIVTGGNEADNIGLSHATRYDPFTDSWNPLPDMNDRRWYPTNVTLADGRILVESGEMTPGLINTLPQVYSGGPWRDLTVAQAERPFIADLYPRLLLAPDGRVFKAGPDQDSWFLDPSGSGHWSEGPLSSLDRPRTYGSAVFLNGKVLLIGGADPPTEAVDLIDLGEADPHWRSVGTMALPRRHHNATILPDGSVLVTTGTSSPGFNDGAAAIRFAEVWNPTTESWSFLASMQTKRVYHSTAILLPDARVLVAGGGQPNAQGDIDHRDAEIFSPPYLFNGPRPTLSSVTPSEVNYGEPIDVLTPEAASITRVSLIRLGSTTHAFDQNQRLVTASFSAIPGGLRVEPPNDRNLVPPGHYMLFLVDGQGTPSVAHIVNVGHLIFQDGFESGNTSRWSSTGTAFDILLRLRRHR